MLTKFKKRLITISTIFSVAVVLSPMAQPTSVMAQNTFTDEGVKLVLNGETLDTSTSMIPTVSYTLVDAEKPSDRIQLDESTIYSDQLTPATQNLDAYFTNDKVDLQTFRDKSTFLQYYWNYSDGSQEIIAPINVTTDLIGDFTIKDLVQSQASDIQHKVNYDFVVDFTDDLSELYYLSQGVATEVLADAKADVYRAEVLFAEMDESDPDYDATVEIMNTLMTNYQALEDRYNSAFPEYATIGYSLTEDVENPDQAQENIDLAVEVVATLPEEIASRITNFYGAPASYFANIAPGFDIHGYATHSNEIFLIDTDPVDKALIYHEIGHIFDFQSTAYLDLNIEEYISFSNSEEWLAILDAEWQGDDGYYYKTPLESFAQGFAGYVVQELEGVQLSDYGYVDTDIANRPMTLEYFENLFADLGIEL